MLEKNMIVEHRFLAVFLLGLMSGAVLAPAERVEFSLLTPVRGLDVEQTPPSEVSPSKDVQPSVVCEDSGVVFSYSKSTLPKANTTILVRNLDMKWLQQTFASEQQGSLVKKSDRKMVMRFLGEIAQGVSTTILFKHSRDVKQSFVVRLVTKERHPNVDANESTAQWTDAVLYGSWDEIPTYVFEFVRTCVLQKETSWTKPVLMVGCVAVGMVAYSLFGRNSSVFDRPFASTNFGFGMSGLRPLPVAPVRRVVASVRPGFELQAAITERLLAFARSQEERGQRSFAGFNIQCVGSDSLERSLAQFGSRTEKNVFVVGKNLLNRDSDFSRQLVRFAPRLKQVGCKIFVVGEMATENFKPLEDVLNDGAEPYICAYALQNIAGLTDAVCGNAFDFLLKPASIPDFDGDQDCVICGEEVLRHPTYFACCPPAGREIPTLLCRKCAVRTVASQGKCLNRSHARAPLASYSQA